VQESHPDDKTALGMVSIVFVLLFVSFFEIGLGAIPWMIGGEMLPEQPRAIGMGLGAAANWIFTTVIALVFPSVQTALGNYSFLPFCVFLAITTVFAYLMVPETKGKSPVELLAWFNRGYVSTHAGALNGDIQQP
jgi:hypothetical protein